MYTYEEKLYKNDVILLFHTHNENKYQFAHPTLFNRTMSINIKSINMKKFNLLLFLFLQFISNIYSCDPIYISFCDSNKELVEEKVFVGKILNQNSQNTEFEIIEILKGLESESTITVWDGSDLECNGTFSMSTAAYGSVGDTVILIVQPISTIENTWDVINDYRRPSSINYTTYLRVDEGFLWDNDLQVSYDDFMTNWDEDGCENIVSNKRPIQFSLKMYPNPASDQLRIKNEDSLWKYYSIISLNGQVVETRSPLHNSNIIEVASLNAGFYILKIWDKNEIEIVGKFVKL